MPDMGPMSEALTESIECVSKSGSAAFSFSIEATRPMQNVPTFDVMYTRVDDVYHTLMRRRIWETAREPITLFPFTETQPEYRGLLGNYDAGI